MVASLCTWIFSFSMAAQVPAVEPAAATQPGAVREWLSVDMQPRAINFGKQALSQEQVAQMLSRRLAPAGIAVVPAGGQPPPGADLEWKLIITGRGKIVSISVVTPEGSVSLFRQIDTRRRRPRDLAHAIALSVTEAMAPVLERLLGFLPEGQFPEISTPASPTTEHRPAPVAVVEAPLAAPPASPPLDLALGLSLGGASAAPGQSYTGGLGLLGQLSHRLVTASLGATLWSPLSASGEDFSLTVQYLTARLALGLTHRRSSWSVTGELGPCVRLMWEDRSGTDIVSGRTWYLGGGIGGALRLTWLPFDFGGLQWHVAADHFYPSQFFTVDARPVLDVGDLMVSIGLSALFVF